MNIAIGSDHAGFDLKKTIKEYLEEKGHKIQDLGTYSEESVDYPDYAHKVSGVVEKGDAKLGVLICGSGNGVNMAANKHKDIRSALCWKAEIAKLARQHNDANIISIPARYLEEEEAIEIIDAFLSSEFEGGRHQTRVEKINPC